MGTNEGNIIGMDSRRHASIPLEQLLPSLGLVPYPALMAEQPSDLRRVRIDGDLWEKYEEIVGDGGRSADIRAYVEWRVDNPTTPLPGRRRGPVRKVRNARTKPKTDAE